MKTLKPINPHAFRRMDVAQKNMMTAIHAGCNHRNGRRKIGKWAKRFQKLSVILVGR